MTDEGPPAPGTHFFTPAGINYEEIRSRREMKGRSMTQAEIFEFAKRIVKALALQFGPTCEVVLHDLTGEDPSSTIIAIENGQISGRKGGDGPSLIAVETMEGNAPDSDRLGYLTKTRDGKILKSSTIYLRDDQGKPIGILAINSDITMSLATENILHSYNASSVDSHLPEQITTNVSDLLDSLIEESIQLVGKPAELMDKNEKIRAIRFLNNSGAFLITKSSLKVCQVFRISKYTLYSYLDEAKKS